MSALLDRIARQVVVPVLRCAHVPDAIATARACAEAGLKIVELTRSTPEVERAIEVLSGDRGITVGLGTVTSAEQIGPAVRAGASFVVSYCAPQGFVEAAHAHGALAIPGAFTPAEVQACVRAGADVVKLFPASQLSPGYIRDLHAVMPGVELLVTGGLLPQADAVRAWVDAGACAVGLGGALGTVATVGEEEVMRRARIAWQAGQDAKESAIAVGQRPLSQT